MADNEKVSITYEVDTSQLKALIEAQRQAAEASKAQAQALGVTTQELKAAEAQLARNTAAEAKAEAQARKLGEAEAKAAQKAAEAQAKLEAQAQKLADSQEAAAKAAKDQLERLTDLGDATAQVQRKFKDTVAQIERLKAATGDETTAAKAMAAAQRQLEADLEAVAQAQREAADSAKEQAEGFGDASSRLAGFAGALDAVVPGLGSALTPMADLAGGAEAAALSASAAGTSLTALAASATLVIAPIAALGAAYVVLTRNIERENAQREIERQLNIETRATYQGLEDAQQALALATGQLTDAQDAELSIRRQIFRAAQDALAAHDEEKKALQEQIDSTQKYINVQRGLALALVAVLDASAGAPVTLARAAASGRTFAEVMADDARALNAAFDSVTGLESGVKAARDQIESYNKSGREQAEILGQTKDALIGADRATRSKEAGDTAAEEALTKLNDALKEQGTLLAANTAALQTSQQQRNAQLEAELAQVAEIEKTTGNAAEAEKLRAAIQEKYARIQDAAYRGQLDALTQITSAAVEGGLTEEDRAQRKLQNDLAQIDRLRNIAVAEAQTQADITRAYGIAAAAREAVLEDFAQTQTERRDAELKAEADHTAKLQSLYLDLATKNLSTLSDLGGSYLDFVTTQIEKTQGALEGLDQKEEARQKNMLERKLERQKVAATVGFRIQQGADIAQATTSTIKGTLDAFNSVIAAVPYPANLILAPVTAGLVAGAGAAQVAAIAAEQPPSFRGGGLIDNESAPVSPNYLPDARLVSAELGEGIVTRRGMQTLGGEEGLDAANNGVAPGPTVVNFQLKNRTLQTVIVDQLSRPSSLRQATRGTRKLATNPYSSSQVL